MTKNSSLVAKANLPPLLPTPPSSIEPYESLKWLEDVQTLQIFVTYTEGRTEEEVAIRMAILIDRMAEYGPWAIRVELLMQPRVIRLWEGPRIYAQHVHEMKSLVNQINQSFKILRRVNAQINLDYANFHQMKLAAALFSLEVDWTLNYHVEGTWSFIKIDPEGHLMRRLRGVYDRDFSV
ncbi:hypothetical protein DSL72_007728 [Monilinia vaccinii-corymbosi]|uniref:Uncharacterized protein n=1 Tax=Monilinia vaccinii-corymbosi TaxID=61207 RepID=A0A8A3PIK7_9HELO|nr:hypothetical protein DSL72_007728 [Monilinia vaccinii-corymbosi]